MTKNTDNFQEPVEQNDSSRLISDDDVDLLMNFTGSSETRWEILLGSPDKKLCALVSKLFENDNRVNITIAHNGCDTLVECSRILPHLVVIDEEFPDIPSIEVIKCIKRREDFKDIMVLYGMKSEKSIGSPELNVDDYFFKTNRDKTYMSRKFNALLFSSNQVPAPKRRWPRKDVNIQAQLEVFSVSNPDYRINGEAQVKNISSTGAYLSRIKLDEKLNPEETYTVRLKIDQPPLKKWVAESIMLHLKSDNTAGLRFVNLSKQDRLKLIGVFD